MIKGMHALLKVSMLNVILETMRSLGGYEAKLLCEWEDWGEGGKWLANLRSCTEIKRINILIMNKGAGYRTRKKR